VRLKSCVWVMAALFALSSDVVAGGAAEERSAEVSFTAIDILVNVSSTAENTGRYNFAGYCYATERVTSGTFEIRPGEPIFLVRLLREANGRSVGFARSSHD